MITEGAWFESFVNLEWCKTTRLLIIPISQFESFVNLEWCKTFKLKHW